MRSVLTSAAPAISKTRGTAAIRLRRLSRAASSRRASTRAWRSAAAGAAGRAGVGCWLRRALVVGGRRRAGVAGVVPAAAGTGGGGTAPEAAGAGKRRPAGSRAADGELLGGLGPQRLRPGSAMLRAASEAGVCGSAGRALRTAHADRDNGVPTRRRPTPEGAGRKGPAPEPGVAEAAGSGVARGGLVRLARGGHHTGVIPVTRLASPRFRNVTGHMADARVIKLGGHDQRPGRARC